MGFIDFTNGEVLTADQMDTVMRQSVMKFADATARDTALSAVLAEGMMCYLDDTNEVLKYDGSSWIDISGDITGVTAGTALTGGGTSGNVILDVDETALTIAQSQVTNLTTDLAGKQDDVITTQGDLVIGDASGDPVRLPVGTADQVLTSDGTTVSFQDAGGGGGGFNTLDRVTASNASYDVSGISGFAKITCIGAGGGGGKWGVSGGVTGGDTTVSDGTNTITGNGGSGAGLTGETPVISNQKVNSNGGTLDEASGNTSRENMSGQGGVISEDYLDLTSISSLNITIGAGGTGGEGARAGGNGLVILEYAS